MSLNKIKTPAKIAINGTSIFRRVGEAVRMKRNDITQIATGNQAAIKKNTIHLFIGRKIKTMVMTASTTA
jgi:hypothetical protein